MAVCEDKVVVIVSGVREEGLEDFRGQDTAGVLGGVVREQFVGEHVGAESEGDTCIGGKVVRVCGNRVLFAVV